MILLSFWPTSRPARWIAGPATRSCPYSRTFTATVVPSSWSPMPPMSPTARNDASPYTMDGSLKMTPHRKRGPRIPYHEPPGKPANRCASVAREQAPKRFDGAWNRGRSCAVVCMVSVGAGAQAEVSEKIRTLGANLLMVMPGARNSGGARLESGTQPTLTEEDAASIRGQVVDVQVAAPLLSRSMPLVAGNRNWMTLVAGINTDYLVAREWQMASGRSFTSAEMGSAAKVAIVGTVIVEALFEGRAGIR